MNLLLNKALLHFRANEIEQNYKLLVVIGYEKTPPVCPELQPARGLHVTQCSHAAIIQNTDAQLALTLACRLLQRCSHRGFSVDSDRGFRNSPLPNTLLIADGRA